MVRSSFMFLLLSGFAITLAASGQQLQLEKKIPVIGMTDGFDHFAYDPATHHIFATAEDQGKVYVLSLTSGKQLATLEGFGKPHSVLVLPGATTALVIDSEPSKSAVLNATALTVVRRLDLPAGANALIYDPRLGQAIITAGGDRVQMKTSEVVALNPKTGQTISSVEVPALHLQPMALDVAGGRVFVSIADHMSVGVFDVKTLRMLAEWKLGSAVHHHQPVAFDPARRRLFVAIDHPGELAVLNSDTGRRVSSVKIADDADDLVFDATTNRLLAPCGEGSLMVLDASGDHLKVVQTISTGKDAATGVWIPNEKRFLLGVPGSSGAGSQAQVQVFTLR